MHKNDSSREQFASRIGFILMTAGCAIGLGNIWRFSYIAGEYGGGFFMILYLLFLALLGTPIMLMELAIGRAGQATYPVAVAKLKNPAAGFHWERPAYLFFTGNFILLMFYTVITGWLMHYAVMLLAGKFQAVSTEDCRNMFGAFTADPAKQIFWTFFALLLTFLICLGGIRRTVERSIKVMMGGLFVLLIVLVFNSLNMPKASEGLEFFLKPDWAKFTGDGIFATVHAALGQAFFTLSLGVGSIAVCGSYISGKNSLIKEGCWIVFLDTLVAVCSGLIIFPACAAFNIQPNAGPPLIFITLPNVFNQMQYGVLWGFLFFIFLSIAALSTLVAVFENLAAFGMDRWHWSRKKSCTIFALALALFTLPCIFGFNIWQNVQPFGEGSNILDLEDFIVSDNLLPLGALYIILFCNNRYGWGREKFLAEVCANSRCKITSRGTGIWMNILFVVILLIWLSGIFKRFGWL